MYSAIKVKGQKLYNLAREGQTIERWARAELRGAASATLHAWSRMHVSLLPCAPGNYQRLAHLSCREERPVTVMSLRLQRLPQPDGAPSGSNAAASSRSTGSLGDNGGRAIFQQGPPRAPALPGQDVRFVVRCSKGTYIRR